MSRETILTCDRCGKSNGSEIGFGWAQVKWERYQPRPVAGQIAFGEADLCPDCSTELGKWLDPE